MKIVTCFIVVGALFVSCCGGQLENNEPVTLKVLSWNIWHAGHSEAYGEKGCEATLDILKDSDADIITMIETYGASDQVADKLGYYHRLISSNLSIYSRYPITKTLLFADTISTFNFGGVEIDVNGRKVRVFDTWIHYLPDTRDVPYDKSVEEIIAWEEAGTRDDELRAILHAIEPYMAEADSIPIIMAGDFNSHSHLDWTHETKDMYDHGGKVVPWTISTMMLDRGFIDSFREINPDPTVNIGTTWMHPATDNIEHRIDYIYYKGSPLKAVESKSYNVDLAETLSFNGKDYFYASDHGFVFTTFEFR